VSEGEVIPFWGPEELDLFTLMTRAIDPSGKITAMMQRVAPIEGQRLLDIGAGVGDRTILYAQVADHVYALEPDPKALPVLRGRIKSSGATNVSVIPGGAAQIPLPDGCIDVAYATWAYFFGPGSEPGLEEVIRVVQSGGEIVIVQNYGHDELSCFWSSTESECENWPTWFEEHGFECEVVDTVWSFQTVDEALAVFEFLWAERARAYVLEQDKSEFGYKVAVYHRKVV
jgi:ubiquinone/menaquinone biosynthesis C-methylase UbiE